MRTEGQGRRALREEKQSESGGRQAPARFPAACPQEWRATHRKGVRSKGSHAPAHLILTAAQGDQRNTAQPDLRHRPGHA